MILLQEDPFDPGEVLNRFSAAMPRAGAVVSFSGKVRPDTGESRVTALFLQYHPVLTEQGIAAAIGNAENRWPLEGSLVIHRTGEILPGETIVLVATASAHRRAAFAAADFLMDYLKTDAVFWKKEFRENGNQWIEPRAEDYEDRARWNKEENK